jgi:hypothetical protein
MYCSTCGARVPEGRSRCDTCGSPVSRAQGYGVPAVSHPHSVPLTMATCPRCGFQGPTVGYFSQGGHVAWLLMLTLFTLFPAMGAGGVLYYILRHNHRSCARCGETLGKSDALALAAASSHGAMLPAGAAAEADIPEERSGWGAGGVMAWGLFIFAAFMLMIGVVEAEAAPLFFGAMAAGGGALLMRRAGNAREERREALLIALQQPVLRLAGQREGLLTVTDVASSLGWPLRRAEKVLNSLEDGFRVSSDVTDEGVIVYEFRELKRAPRLSAAEMDNMLSGGPNATQAALPPQNQSPSPIQPQDETLRA